LEENKLLNAEKKKVNPAQTDKYYKIKADFRYLASYNYKITKEIGRGGYGVVYKVICFLSRPSAPTYSIRLSSPSR
jgi:cell division control protein 7